MKEVKDKEVIKKIKAYCKKNMGSKAIGTIKEDVNFYAVDILKEYPTAHTIKIFIPKTEIEE